MGNSTDLNSATYQIRSYECTSYLAVIHKFERKRICTRAKSEAQDIERDHWDSISKSSDTGSCAKAGHISHDGLLRSESLFSLREVRFSEQKFPTGTPVSNIKFDYPGSQNDNLFYPFYNHLDYALAHYFAKSETTKGNTNKSLSNPLMTLLTEKPSYQNPDKWIEKLSEIS